MASLANNPSKRGGGDGRTAAIDTQSTLLDGMSTMRDEARGARVPDIHQQIWVQDGTIEVTLAKITHRLSEDDCLAMQLDQPAAFRNRSRKPGRYVVIVSAERAHAGRK
jgi:hypothetical protein